MFTWLVQNQLNFKFSRNYFFFFISNVKTSILPIWYYTVSIFNIYETVEATVKGHLPDNWKTSPVQSVQYGHKKYPVDG